MPPLMVKKGFTIFVRSRETVPAYGGDMDAPFIHGRLALDDASDLIERYGHRAATEAKARAKQSRDDGNVFRFCHWRQIARIIVALSSDEVRGTVH
jgi:hypothetical protein